MPNVIKKIPPTIRTMTLNIPFLIWQEGIRAAKLRTFDILIQNGIPLYGLLALLAKITHMPFLTGNTHMRTASNHLAKAALAASSPVEGCCSGFLTLAIAGLGASTSAAVGTGLTPSAAGFSGALGFSSGFGSASAS